MGQHKIESTAVRTLMLRTEHRRLERIKAMRSESRMRIVPGKARRSTRGETKETWRTKAWTPARDPFREARKKAEQDRRAKLASKAAHITRQGDDPHP